jgi:hypothetical protein
MRRHRRRLCWQYLQLQQGYWVGLHLHHRHLFHRFLLLKHRHRRRHQRELQMNL